LISIRFTLSQPTAAAAVLHRADMGRSGLRPYIFAAYIDSARRFDAHSPKPGLTRAAFPAGHPRIEMSVVKSNWRGIVLRNLCGKLTVLLIVFLASALCTPAKHETGFLDRSVTIGDTTYRYQVFVPEDWTPHQKWPVILFLHGSGERGEDGLDETDVGIGTAIRSDRGHFEAIVVMPQCRKNTWWTEPPMGDLAMTALRNATREFHGDTNRTYLTGISMGGYGSWYLAQKYPNTFAALVIVCGGIHPPAATLKAHPELVNFSPPDGPKAYTDAAAKIGKVPVWIFHGADDNIVPVVESQRMADAMKAVGAEVHYTEYSGVKHVAWDKAYDEPKLYPWLYSKTLADRER
jgi:predicted esterase